MNSSAHMKLAIECCVPKKRKYVNVMRSPYHGLSETLNVPSMERLANQKNVLNPLMIEEVTSMYRSHENAKKDVSTMKGKVLLDDFDDVANGKGKVILDEFEDVGNAKGKVVLDESKDGLV
ncbi:hypothetical protein Tco_1499420 [Tanacetum coccineum]